MTTQELKASRPPDARVSDTFASGAEVYRRLERRQRRPSRRMAISLAIIAVAVSAAAVVLERTSRPDLARATPAAQQAQVP